jgi:hypothetical protein
VYNNTDPIARGQAWSPELDIQRQLEWQKDFTSSLNREDIIQAGVYLQPPKFAVQKLAPREQNSGQLPMVRDFADHSYPQSACGGAKTDLVKLQNHTNTAQYVKTFQPEVVAAHAVNKSLVFGETNSATCGGGGISPTFGAALWIVDYVLQSVLLGYERLHFHQGK